MPEQAEGTGGIKGKNTQLELSDYAVGRERDQTSQRKRLVPISKKKKNVPEQSVGINPSDHGGETHLYTILPNV